MNIKQNKDELDLAVEEFEKTFKDFEKAAKNLISIMDSMNKKKYQELNALSPEAQKIYQFLIQMTDESGQIEEERFGIRCMTEEPQKEKR